MKLIVIALFACLFVMSNNEARNARRRQVYAMNKRQKLDKELAQANDLARKINFEQEWSRRESNRQKSAKNRMATAARHSKEMYVFYQPT